MASISAHSLHGDRGRHHGVHREQSKPAPAPGMSVFVKALLALALFSVAITVAGRLYGGHIRMGGNSADTRAHEIVIGNAVFDVPENHIRFQDQRVGGVAARLDLFAAWPGMDGYAPALRHVFEAHADESPSVIFLTIEPQQMSRDMTGRLEPIYRQLVEPLPDGAAPAGLQAFRFKADHAIFSNEVLYVEAAAANPFVARCITGEEAAAALAPCERDLLLEGEAVSVKYRFPAALLARHGELDAAVMGLIASFRPGA